MSEVERRPVATPDYLVRQVDDFRQPLYLVCLELDISVVVGARLLAEGRKIRVLRRALGQRERGG